MEFNFESSIYILMNFLDACWLAVFTNRLLVTVFSSKMNAPQEARLKESIEMPHKRLELRQSPPNRTVNCRSNFEKFGCC